MTRRLHIVPVGISMLDNVKEEGPAVLRNALCRRNVWGDLQATSRGNSVVPDSILGVDGSPPENVRSALRGLPAKACAEWQALDQYDDQFGRAEQNTWVFVGSDTEDGSRAALFTALGHARRQDDVPLRYLSAPGDAASAFLAPGGAYLVRLPGLDLAHPPGRGLADPDGIPVPTSTWQAMGELGGLAVVSALAPGRCEVVFHLSGGYKAMLPHFLTMAQAVRTDLMGRRAGITVSAYCLHETSRRPVALPVPYFTGVVAEWLKQLAGAAGDGALAVDEKIADGLAGLYLDTTVHHGQRRLTPAGIIIARTLWALHSTS